MSFLFLGDELPVVINFNKCLSVVFGGLGVNLEKLLGGCMNDIRLVVLKLCVVASITNKGFEVVTKTISLVG